MTISSLYKICRLCTSLLDHDAIDCSKAENSDLRENIEMIYQVKIKSSDKFTTKVCSRCSDVVVASTMQFIRVQEAQSNLQSTLCLQNDINASLKKGNSLAGKKRPRSSMQIGPISKRPRTHSDEVEIDKTSGKAIEKRAKTENQPAILKPRPMLSPKKSPIKPATTLMNNQLFPTDFAAPMTCAMPTTAINPDLFKLQQSYTKSMGMSNLSNINLNNNNYLRDRQFATQSSTLNPLLDSYRIQNEFSRKKKVINSFTAAEVMKRIVIPPVGALRMARTTNSLFNVANNLHKHSTSSQSTVKASSIVELTRKMAKLRLSGYCNDIWSRVWPSVA